jgi:heme-degrading monooxygenase HmoA
MNRRTANLALASISFAPVAALSQGVPTATPLGAAAAVVRVPTPWYAPRSLVTSRMRDTTAQYAALPGLAYKAFSLGRTDRSFGGLYLWQSLAAARAWFSPEWFARVERERGSKADVRFFEVSHVLDNTPGGTPAAPDSHGVGTVVSVPAPAQVPHERVIEQMGQSIAPYRAVPGLMRKYFTYQSSDHSFGGIYLWRDLASARDWFNDAWHARVKAQYAAEARIEWYDTPILLPTTEARNRVPTIGPA